MCIRDRFWIIGTMEFLHPSNYFCPAKIVRVLFTGCATPGMGWPLSNVEGVESGVSRICVVLESCGHHLLSGILFTSVVACAFDVELVLSGTDLVSALNHLHGRGC